MNLGEGASECWIGWRRVFAAISVQGNQDKYEVQARREGIEPYPYPSTGSNYGSIMGAGVVARNKRRRNRRLTFCLMAFEQDRGSTYSRSQVEEEQSMYAADVGGERGWRLA